MKRAFLVGLTLFILATGPALAGPVQKIELNDGSVIQGEVLSFDGSLYKIRTASLGTITVPASRVRTIHTGTGGSGSSLTERPEYRELQQSILGSPEALNMILGLQNDPDVQAVLQDPELMKAVQAGDLERLLASPKFMRLLENPKIQDIGKRVLR
ncbi:MAG: hypothetical protein AB1512_16310 [Thermodesulfobacteriota bacterium]